MRKPPFFLTCLTVSALAISSGACQQKAAAPAKVDFVRDVKPIFEGACIQCHGPDENELEANYRMDTKEAFFKGGETYGEDVVRLDDVNDSPVYWMTEVHLDDPKDPEAMPPKRPLNERQIGLIKGWIEQGAEWPDDLVLKESPRVMFRSVKPLLIRGGPYNSREVEILRNWAAQGSDWPKDGKLASVADDVLADDINLTSKIRDEIVKTSTEKSEADMKGYENSIPKTGVKYEMVAIKGGEFTMGSPDSESTRNSDEGPQRKVKVAPFWMGKFEVSWDMYEPYMITDVARNKDGSPETIAPDAALADIVSSPTTPYQEMSFGMGTQGFPAICMTQHAANKFCQWLSAQTGHYYRLPTEAEWEYACRAGTEGPYHCEEDQLAEYAVLDPEQTRVGYEKVGTKKPNAWGLHDMHGNVLEWCLDQYFDKYPAEPGENPLEIPTTLYPRVARGGSWYDTSEYLRSAARTASDANWKQQDPQLPKSIWYHTDATWLGFRIVRPLTVPELQDMHELWNIGTKDEDFTEITSMLEEGEKPADFDKELKPLLERGGPYSETEIAVFRRWAKEGAPWPEETVLELAE